NSCTAKAQNLNSELKKNSIGKEEIRTGAQQSTKYLPLLKGKRVGVVTNQTGITDGSIIGKKSCSKNPETSTCAIFEQISIVDFLLENEIDVKKIFSPEHGFRGDADA